MGSAQQALTKLLFLFFFVSFTVAVSVCDGTKFTIQDDSNLNSIIAEAREEFLASRPESFDVLDVSLLIPSTSGNETVWKRGSYNPFELGYPARYELLVAIV